MSALQAECIAVQMAMDCLASGEVARSRVWLRLADEAHFAWIVEGCTP